MILKSIEKYISIIVPLYIQYIYWCCAIRSTTFGILPNLCLILILLFIYLKKLILIDKIRKSIKIKI